MEGTTMKPKRVRRRLRTLRVSRAVGVGRVLCRRTVVQHWDILDDLGRVTEEPVYLVARRYLPSYGPSCPGPTYDDTPDRVEGWAALADAAGQLEVMCGRVFRPLGI